MMLQATLSSRHIAATLAAPKMSLESGEKEEWGRRDSASYYAASRQFKSGKTIMWVYFDTAVNSQVPRNLERSNSRCFQALNMERRWGR